MKTLTPILFITLVLLLTNCDEDKPVEPLPPVVQDTCYNDAPISPADSATQQWPSMHAVYEIRDVRISTTTGFWTGFGRLMGWEGLMQDGIFVYDPEAEIPIWFLSRHQARWSPDGKRLLCDGGFNSFEIYDVASKTLVVRIERPHNATDSWWSLDGEYVYYNSYGPSGYGGIWRVRPDGSEAALVASQIFNARELDDQYFVGFDENGMYLYDKRDGTLSWPDFPNLDKDALALIGIDSWDISPDRTKILADVIAKTGFIEGRDIGGLFLFDLQQKTARKIMPQQYWGTHYNPTWISNRRFYGSWFCRTKVQKTSMSMIWEYDLIGNVIRQITFPWMWLYPR